MAGFVVGNVTKCSSNRHKGNFKSSDSTTLQEISDVETERQRKREVQESVCTAVEAVRGPTVITVRWTGG